MGLGEFGSDQRRALTLGVLTVAWACSVFPDEVELPASPGAGGAAGAFALGGAHVSGGVPAEGGFGVSVAGFHSSGGASPSGGAESWNGGVGEGGSESPGGSKSLGGSGGTSPSGFGGTANIEGGMGGILAGGAGAASGGAAGGSTQRCEQPLRVTVGATADTWIDAASTVTHGDDATLRVAAGVAERRALLTFDWNANIVPERAELFFYLNANLDSSARARSLGVFALTRSFDEGKTDWANYGSGSSREWDHEGADFGASFRPLAVAEGVSRGELSVDVTPLIVDGSMQTNLIVLEIDVAPPAPNELQFGSSEDSVNGPRLVLTYCPQ